VPPALVALFAFGWTVLPGGAWFWTALALLVLCLPLLLHLLAAIVTLLRGTAWLPALRDIQGDTPYTAGQVLLTICFLTDQARLMLDAVARTFFRLTCTRRRMLEWETAATTERRLGSAWNVILLTMWPAPVFAAALGALVGVLRPESLPLAVPFLLAWFVAPGAAYWSGQPRRVVAAPLREADRRALRRVARKTWHFFETFVGDADNWLPPDNYQEDPKGQVAHRTSPTNQGLLLLSTLAAHDFGYLSLPQLVGRLEKTLATLSRLERHHGHFLNWYETTTLQPLQPAYVSTVDSGNLMGCLIALKQGLREKAEEVIPGPAWREGLRDTLTLVTEMFAALDPAAETPASAPPLVNGRHAQDADGGRARKDVLLALQADLQELGRQLEETPADLAGWDEWLERLERRAATLPRQVRALANAIREVPEALTVWVKCFVVLVEARREELNGLAPWAKLLRQEPAPDGPADDRQRWLALRQALAAPISIAEVLARRESLLAELKTLQELHAAQRASLGELALALDRSAASEWQRRCHALADRAAAFAGAMDFRLLYDDQRMLFSIGYNLVTGKLDNSYYDLLASEARLASFLAIARGDADRKHWFQLGRPLTRAAGTSVLLSWGGTMFEYLMPRLLLPTYPGTLLDESCRGAVARQIEYGRQCHTPWGISESGYAALDAALDYQYQSFGVPGLGLKRGLARDLVIAPYATALALLVNPAAAARNFAALTREGGEGAFGYYEAIDYTRDRLLKKRRSMIVRSYMAHHQGMSLTALADCLLHNPMPRRFHAEPMVRATELLLQERMPRAAPLVQPHADEVEAAGTPPPVYQPMSRRLTTPQTPVPRTHLLSNGRYTVMVTNAGAGFSAYQGLDVTRWREDRTRDTWGQFVYLRDLRTGEVWSAAYQPIGRAADDYEVIYSADKAEFRRRDEDVETHLEIAVTPESSAEVRRLTLINHGSRPHELEVTSYAEVVLGPHAADLAHPAFGKLFLETEFIAAHDALLCRRRPRSEEQKPAWAVHVMAVDAPTLDDLQYETDRLRFLGRGRTPANPAALDPGTVLSGATGPVLDPIFSLRRAVRLMPRATVTLSFTTGAAESREEALALASQYHDPRAIGRALELAWAHSQVELRHLHVSPEEVHLYQRLASSVLYAGMALRAAPETLIANQQGQPALWRYGISGDNPIVLVQVGAPEELAFVRQLLSAHTFWRLKGLIVDLVILNEHPGGYFEELHHQLQELVRSGAEHGIIDRPGGVFLRKAAQIPPEDRMLLQAAARVVLSAARGSLAGQVDHLERSLPLPERFVPTEPAADEEARAAPAVSEDGQFFNGLGAFTADGREYVLAFDPAAADRATTPLPWVNVIANPRCGFLVSERAAGYTWAGNSQINRLTPWSNDWVSDPPGEAIFLRDEASGAVWRVPGPGAGPYRCRHGQGYTVFEQEAHGLSQELLFFVPADDPIKVMRLRLRNTGGQPRRLSATFYAEWVLGTARDQAAMNVITELDAESGALLARNALNQDFAAALAFADVSLRPRTLTADRTEFLGRNFPGLDAAAVPAALTRAELSGRTGPALDPCAAVQATFDLAPGEEKEVIFYLGEGTNRDEVRQLLRRYRDPGQVQAALDAVRQRWERVLTAVQVRTPNPALDLMLNRWLLYQVLGCRVWARSAFYQSGGAYGFRDQLQDVMALVYGAPEETRAQILRAAGRQFLEGDVQHWWHPPAGRGVRTRFSDDFLWLVLVTCHYVSTTGDTAILDEQIPFLKAPLLAPEQDESYGLPEVTAETATLYEHCIRALEHGFRYGAHGLPLMGTGDWNDGMNRVGAGGKGESVWDAWFQITILRRFAELADARGQDGKRYRDVADRLVAAVEAEAWDGRWYRRAYFDDGTPLGSAQNDECKIDSIAQTWAVISGAAQPERARQAMAAVDEFLVKRAERLILLFTPPFDHGNIHPGYIKGYVPGIRENGGQYTHAATWVVQAAALLGQGARALEYYELLNPVRHAETPEQTALYKVEPYVVVADLYGAPPHVGRGGWTWYTGSAGWLYRVALESILGFELRGNRLIINPCVARDWRQFEITYRHRSATYHITVMNPNGVERGVRSVEVDGTVAAGNAIELRDDGKRHEVRVTMGA
jgi:cyclic beta-1,2-glucan synthetase